MKPTKTNNQVSLWDYCRSFIEGVREKDNQVGPYKLNSDSLVERYFDCKNYDQCLSFASGKNWISFSCRGCRKTASCKVK